MTCVEKTTSNLDGPRCGSSDMLLSLLRSSADTVSHILKQAKKMGQDSVCLICLWNWYLFNSWASLLSEDELI